jgi:predicted MFS family arabinose efflux permease
VSASALRGDGVACVVGFAVGAVPADVLADAYGITAVVWVVAAITAASGAVVALRMYEARPA